MRRTFYLFLLLILCFVWSSTALAQVQVKLRVIGASNEGKSIDPSLTDIYKELGSLFSFTSYRLFRDEKLTLSLNQPVSISTLRRVIEVTSVGTQKDVVELRIKAVREGKEILNTQVRLFRGRTVLIGGGPRQSIEGIIIYALQAHF